jgi:hypothetical protein
MTMAYTNVKDAFSFRMLGLERVKPPLGRLLASCLAAMKMEH